MIEGESYEDMCIGIFVDIENKLGFSNFNDYMYTHECLEWDGMEINAFCPEFMCCTCGYDSTEAHLMKALHNYYLGKQNEKTEKQIIGETE